MKHQPGTCSSTCAHNSFQLQSVLNCQDTIYCSAEYYQPGASYFQLMPCKAIKVEILHPCAIRANDLSENSKMVKANENQTLKVL